jgi:glucan endo-1,3-alpha-glucosidase
MFFKKQPPKLPARPSQHTHSSKMTPSAHGEKHVFCHFMMGNTYPYTETTFLNDISVAQSAGIDGFALNIGQDTWTSSRIATFFAASQQFHTFKLFFSFDMSIIVDANTIVNYVLQYKDHPNSYKYRGKYFMSTFAGESTTFGHRDPNQGWDKEVISKLRDRGVEVCFVPSFSGVDAWQMYNKFPVVDGAFSWAAWYPLFNSFLQTILILSFYGDNVDTGRSRIWIRQRNTTMHIS